MQTEAAPREPFTLGVLLRYKFTIVLVAFFVIFGGYARIITQPPLYEATARLAVRFTRDNRKGDYIIPRESCPGRTEINRIDLAFGIENNTVHHRCDIIGEITVTELESRVDKFGPVAVR